MAEDSRRAIGDDLFYSFHNYFRCSVNQMVKIILINLLEMVRKQGLETETWRFYVFASPAIKGVCSAPPLVVSPHTVFS